MKRLTYLSLIFTLALACGKEEIITHQELLVTGNAPPPYNGVSSILVENYVSKIYIDLIGLKPSINEKDIAVSYLMDNDLSIEAREKVIGDVMDQQAYHERLFQISSDLLLNGMSYDDVLEQHTVYSAVKDLFYLQGDTFSAQYIENEIQKLQLVLDANADYMIASITLNEYYYRLSYNLIYDEINMGSENFVISCFENLFKRYPTASELSSGVDMVDGISTVILLKEGRTKTDFLKIMIEDTEFYQGRIIDAYESLLLRPASSSELGVATTTYRSSKDYYRVQMDIVKTDEYAGFE